MEEVYVIKLKGVPSTSTSEISTTIESSDLARISSLGLGVLHIIFGILVLLFGALRSAADQEPSDTIFGALFGPVFLVTGLSAVLSWRRPFRKLKLKVFFALSLLSAMGSAAFFCLCFLGVVYYHSVPRVFGDSARITANAIIATVAEFVISVLSLITTGTILWPCTRWGALRQTADQQPMKQKVIVKTNIVGSSPNGLLDEDVIRHVSPNCVISLRATDEKREMVRRVHEYVRDLNSQEDVSFTFSDISTAADDEQDLGVDSQNWRNEVLTVASQKSCSNSVEPDT